MRIDSVEEFLKEARSYIGVKWKHRGRSRTGIDCGGLVVAPLITMGVPVKDLAGYGREPHRDGLRQLIQENFGAPIDKNLKQVGDIALIAFKKQPHHVGIIGDYIHGGFSLLHSYGDEGKVVEHRLDSVWDDMILEVYRFEITKK